MNQSPFEPRRRRLLRPPILRRPRFRAIPVRTLVPNIITLLALCAGLTAIRLAVEDRLEDGRLVFDYRMKPGVVARSNALDLMRAVGLDV